MVVAASMQVRAAFRPPPGNLPRDRTEGSRPFQVVGVDFAGPIKYRVTQKKVNEVVAKASKRLHILRVLKRGGVPPADLLKVYFALIRSVLEYCCPVWHNALPVKLSDSIERVQKRALRIIYPALH